MFNAYATSPIVGAHTNSHPLPIQQKRNLHITELLPAQKKVLTYSHDTSVQQQKNLSKVYNENIHKIHDDIVNIEDHLEENKKLITEQEEEVLMLPVSKLIFRTPENDQTYFIRFFFNFLKFGKIIK